MATTPKRPTRPAKRPPVRQPQQDEMCPIHGHMEGMDPHQVEKYMKDHIPPMRIFMVRRPTPESMNSTCLVHEEVAVEAHTYNDRQCGALSFTRYEYDQHMMCVMQRFYMIMAPGTWFDVREVSEEMSTQSAN